MSYRIRCQMCNDRGWSLRMLEDPFEGDGLYFGGFIYADKTKAAIRSVIEDSHSSYFLRHEVSPRAVDETVETLYQRLVAPVLRKLAGG